jgi:hypothetical protein
MCHGLLLNSIDETQQSHIPADGPDTSDDTRGSTDYDEAGNERSSQIQLIRRGAYWFRGHTG